MWTNQSWSCDIWSVNDIWHLQHFRSAVTTRSRRYTCGRASCHDYTRLSTGTSTTIHADIVDVKRSVNNPDCLLALSCYARGSRSKRDVKTTTKSCDKILLRLWHAKKREDEGEVENIRCFSEICRDEKNTQLREIRRGYIHIRFRHEMFHCVVRSNQLPIACRSDYIQICIIDSCGSTLVNKSTAPKQRSESL